MNSYKLYSGHSGPITSLTINHDGNKFISSSMDGNIILWDVESGKQLRVYNLFEPIWSADLSKCGN